MIYFLTAVELSPGGSTHLHTNNTQNNTNNNRRTQITTDVEECGPCHVSLLCLGPCCLPFVYRVYELYHRSPICIILHHVYLLCTSLHKSALQTTVFNFWYFITSFSLLFNRYREFYPKTVWLLNFGVIWIHFHCICILVLTALKMATWVAETYC